MNDDQASKPRLWLLPWGLYPPRITIYLAEKGISDIFDIIPVGITPTGMEEVEGKPPGTLPILELQRPSKNEPGRYIFQSSAILEYLEDKYGSEGPDMRGATPEARARVRECLDVANEICTWVVLYVQNGSTLYEAMRPQSKEAAREGLERMHKALSLLERFADPESVFLVGDSPTIVDCVLMATVRFTANVYKIDIVEGHARLRRVVDAFEKRGTAEMPQIPEAMQEMGITMHVK